MAKASKPVQRPANKLPLKASNGQIAKTEWAFKNPEKVEWVTIKKKP